MIGVNENIPSVLQVGTESYVCCRRSLYVWRDGLPVRRDGGDLGDLCDEQALCCLCELSRCFPESLRADNSLMTMQAHLLVAMATATTESEVGRCLVKLGASMPLHRNPLDTLRIFQRYAVVGIGPSSRALWGQGASRQDSF